MTTTIIIISLSILFSIFFTGMEGVFTSVNRLKLELKIKQESIISRIIGVFFKSPTQYVATMMLGNIFSLVVFGVYSSILFLELFFPNFPVAPIPFWLIVIQIIIASVLIILSAEFLPKVVFGISPNNTLRSLAIPTFIVYILLYPAVKVILFLSHFFLKLLTGDNDYKQKPLFAFESQSVDVPLESEEEEDSDNEEEASIDSQDIKLFKNVLEFSDIKLKECLIPRTEIVAVEVDSTVDELKKLFIETGFARLIIYKENIDHVMGYVHSSILFTNPKTIEEIVTEVPIVPESMPASKVLSRLNEENKGIAVVVDEFGGTEGIVTQEDIMEEIFGEIEDEHDKNTLTDRQVSDNEFILSGRHEIDFVNEKYELNLPTKDDYETIAGLILHVREDIPKLNEEIIIEDIYKFRIVEVSNIRIDQVHLIVDNS